MSGPSKSGLPSNAPKAMRINPLILHTTVTVAPNATVQPLTAPLQNPFREAMWVDEVRFAIPITNPLAFFVKLELGRVPLTNGFINPICFARMLNMNVLAETDLNFTWRFPRPLLVPATELLLPTIQNIPLTGAGSSGDIGITYVCRSYIGKDQPDVINLPWCAAYQSRDISDADAYAFTEESTESDLCNPFNEPLNLQRFVCAKPMRPNALEIDLVHNLTSTLVRLSDSQGRHVVSTPTPIGHLCFLPDGGIWNVNAVIPPKSFFKSWWDINQAVAGAATKQFLGIVGHREVRIR